MDWPWILALIRTLLLAFAVYCTFYGGLYLCTRRSARRQADKLSARNKFYEEKRRVEAALSRQQAERFSEEGTRLGIQRRFDEAIECFDQAIICEQSSATHWYHKGLCLMAVRRYDEALICLDTAVQRAPNNVRVCEKRDYVKLRLAQMAEIQTRAKAFANEEAARIRTARQTKLDGLLRLHNTEFEDAVADLYLRLGYQVQQTPYTNDGGKDAIAIKDGVKYLIECKQYNERQTIGRPMLQQFVGAMVGERVSNGIFVTTSSFSAGAKEYAANNGLTLVDGCNLVLMMQKAYSSVGNPDKVRQLCLTCGAVVDFDLDATQPHKACSNGHEVVRAISADGQVDLTQFGDQVSPPSSYPPRTRSNTSRYGNSRRY